MAHLSPRVRKNESGKTNETTAPSDGGRGSEVDKDRRSSEASKTSGDAETNSCERRVSHESFSSGEHLHPSPGSKKVNFSEQATVKESGKRHSQSGAVTERQTSQGEEGSPKNQRKIVSTWKMACGMTKDKTKDLLKRWRTLPDTGPDRLPLPDVKTNTGDQGWSVHVWGDDSIEENDSSNLGIGATWVKRCPSDDDQSCTEKERDKSWSLTETQKEKLSHFFSHVFDMDRDDMIALQDIEGFTERLRHFAEWSSNCGEYLILLQVQQGLVDTFISFPQLDDASYEGSKNQEAKSIDRLFLSIEHWLDIWEELLQNKKNFDDLPLWLQYFPKIIFAAINKSGSNSISKDELGAFYSSVLGYPSQKLKDLLNDAFNAMTAGGDFKLTYDCYRLIFANFLFGRYPNGPGQFVFGASQRGSPPIFPIDYSAMNARPGEIETFNGSLKSNRSSIIV